jgi:hypothetical protein
MMRQAIVYELCRESIGQPPSFFNAVMTVWVCTLNELDTLRVRRNIEGSQIAAFRWAESCGYSFLDCDPIWKAYGKLMRELTASLSARVRGGVNGEKKTTGEPLPQ